MKLQKRMIVGINCDRHDCGTLGVVDTISPNGDIYVNLGDSIEKFDQNEIVVLEKKMSADNGIYILVSPILDENRFEFRVAECQAIDRVEIDDANIYYDGSLYYIHELNEVIIFGNSKVYSTKEEAMMRALELENDSYEKKCYIEYGIKLIRQQNPFTTDLTVGKAKIILNEYFKE